MSYKIKTEKEQYNYIKLKPLQSWETCSSFKLPVHSHGNFKSQQAVYYAPDTLLQRARTICGKLCGREGRKANGRSEIDLKSLPLKEKVHLKCVRHRCLTQSQHAQIPTITYLVTQHGSNFSNWATAQSTNLLLPSQSTKHYIQNTCVSWSVTNHITFVKVCNWTLHMLLGSCREQSVWRRCLWVLMKNSCFTKTA